MYNAYTNSFKLFGCKRKLDIFSFVEGFFEFHSRATEGEKDKIRAKKKQFFSKLKKCKRVLNKTNLNKNKSLYYTSSDIKLPF